MIAVIIVGLSMAGGVGATFVVFVAGVTGTSLRATVAMLVRK